MVKPIHICVFGAPIDVGNMGCRALTVSIIGLVKKVFPSAEISLLYGNKTGGKVDVDLGDEMQTQVDIVNYRLSPRANPRVHLISILLASIFWRLCPVVFIRKKLESLFPWIHAIRNADIVADICAGDSFADIYGLKNFWLTITPQITARVLKKKVIMLPQTYGPFSGHLSKLIAAYLLKSSSILMSRDIESIDYIKTLTHNSDISNRVVSCPDIAFTLQCLKPGHAREWINSQKQSGKFVVGLNASGLLLPSGKEPNKNYALKLDYKRLLCIVIESLLNEPNTSVCLIPHVFDEGPESDVTACKTIFDSVPANLKDRIHVVDGDLNQSKLKSLIGECDFFIGSRMHACIAALSQSVPVIAIAYSRKFSGVFGMLKATQMVVNPETNTTQAIVNTVIQTFRNRLALRNQTSEIVEKTRSMIFTTVSSVLNSQTHS